MEQTSLLSPAPSLRENIGFEKINTHYSARCGEPLKKAILMTLPVAALLFFTLIGVSYLPGNNAFTPLQTAQIRLNSGGAFPGAGEFRQRTMVLKENDAPPPSRMLLESGPFFVFFTLIAFMIYYTGKVSRFRKMIFMSLGMVILLFFVTYPPGSSFWALFGSGQKVRNISCYYDLPFFDMPRLASEPLIWNEYFNHPNYSSARPESIFAAYGDADALFKPRGLVSWFDFWVPCAIVIWWVGILVVIGRGWCSWLCPFGGIDETFANLSRKARIKVKVIAPILRYLPYGVLLLIAYFLVSAKTYFFCIAECAPLGRLGYFEGSFLPDKVTGWTTYLLIAALLTLLLAIFVVLPYLTKKRIQCGLFCPLGALSALLGKFSPTKIKVDTSKCILCEQCVTKCPTFSMTPESIRSGSPTMSCTRCGSCVDACATSAVGYRIFGARFDAKYIFVATAVIVSALFYRGMVFYFIASL